VDPGHIDPIRLTVSIGISSSGTDNRTIEQLLRNADHALYVAKRDGRNRVAVAT
jgi:diguanylate cyclase (GGDEF)-like protein